MPYSYQPVEVETLLGRRYATYRIQGTAIGSSDVLSVNLPDNWPKNCTLTYLSITGDGVDTFQPAVTVGRSGGATTETAATSIENQQPLVLDLPESRELAINPNIVGGPGNCTIVLIVAEGHDLRGA